MRKLIIGIGIIMIIMGGIFWYINNHKGVVLQKTIQNVDKVLKFDKLDDSTKEKFGTIQDIANALLVQDNVTRRYLIFLQNNFELRPGGGFLGQYAIVEVKNGEIISHEVKDTNVLDNTYKSDMYLPENLQKYLIGTKKWKIRDANYSPDFPKNVKTALHFFELGGVDVNFDGVFAINSSVFEKLLKITGPISVTEKDFEKYGEFNADGALWKLQKIVEEPVFRADYRKQCEKEVRALGAKEHDKRFNKCRYDENGKKYKRMNKAQRADRKLIMDALEKEMVKKLVKINNIEPLIQLFTESLNQKDIQLWFKDEKLQQLARTENWTGEVDRDWDGDYVMISDANIGALKSDYYMRRSMEYKIDFTGKSAEVNDPSAGRMVRYITPTIKEQVMSGKFVTNKPLATVRMTYKNTATESSYFNSDYHSFTRLYVPNGSKWYIREWFEAPGIDTEVFGNKQVYKYKFDVLLGQTIPTMLQYTLPETIKEDGYKLKIQKQSGLGNIPLTVTVITSEGKKYTKEVTFKSDMIFKLQDEKDGKELVVVE